MIDVDLGVLQFGILRIPAFIAADSVPKLSSRAVVSAVMTGNIKVECKRESRDLPEKCLYQFYYADNG